MKGKEMKIVNQGYVEGIDWMVLDTAKGAVVWHQIWVGPGLATEDEISHTPTMTDEEAYDYAMEAAENWSNNPSQDEKEPAPHIGPVYRV
jgi:hypothetical protein